MLPRLRGILRVHLRFDGQPGLDLAGRPRVGVLAAGMIRHDRAAGRTARAGLEHGGVEMMWLAADHGGQSAQHRLERLLMPRS
jgi:hypothetical protein